MKKVEINWNTGLAYETLLPYNLDRAEFICQTYTSGVGPLRVEKNGTGEIPLPEIFGNYKKLYITGSFNTYGPTSGNVASVGWSIGDVSLYLFMHCSLVLTSEEDYNDNSTNVDTTVIIIENLGEYVYYHYWRQAMNNTTVSYCLNHDMDIFSDVTTKGFRADATSIVLHSITYPFKANLMVYGIV